MSYRAIFSKLLIAYFPSFIMVWKTELKIYVIIAKHCTYVKAETYGQ